MRSPFPPGVGRQDQVGGAGFGAGEQVEVDQPRGHLGGVVLGLAAVGPAERVHHQGLDVVLAEQRGERGAVLGVAQRVAASSQVDQQQPVIGHLGVLGPSGELGAGDLIVEDRDVAAGGLGGEPAEEGSTFDQACAPG